MATNALEPIHLRRSAPPVTRAPPEILQQIFNDCFDTRFPHNHPFSATEAPLLLCGVCRSWRTLAISTPELWAQISVSIGRKKPDTVEPSPDLINNWIERSGGVPLTLVLQDVGLPSGSPDVDAANDLLGIFLRQVHRWKSITIFLPNHTFPASLTALEAPFGRASVLQIAKFGFGVQTGPGLNAPAPQIGALSRILTSSAQLHTLYWRNDLDTLRSIDIRWAQLTVVDLVPVWQPMSQIVEIIRKAPLRSLSVFIFDACDIAAPLFLPDLVRLWIGTEVDLSPLFRQLTLPSLQNINVFCTNSLIPQTEVVSCLVRSGSLVNAAIFKSLRIPKADLITFLRSSPSLRLLDISDNGEAIITDDVLGLLTVDEEPYVCPKLCILRFLESSVSSADGVLAAMVSSRLMGSPSASHPVTLSRLSVHFSDADLPRHGEDIRRLKDLGAAAGFRVWVNEPETEDD